ncbi:MAG: 4'-phosphopantetheinyl transferase superfamily protein [Luteolibacter sp.]|jgi:4'-phosphopantetheinyl transferase|nr:4'-phosphopantetheinyl transferase superfamily protein [Luteolibacter sp.]
MIPGPGQAVVHLMEAAGRGTAADHAILSKEEHDRAERFHFETDRQRWIGWRAGLRRILGRYLGMSPVDVPLVADESGKPRLAAPHGGWHFNLSHASSLAALVIAREGPVGVDLEETIRAGSLAECTDEFCHPAEIEALPAAAAVRCLALLHLWTCKEALLKALGTGFAFPPRTLRITGCSATADSPLPGLDGLHLVFPPPPPDHLLAVALPLSIRHLEIINDTLFS